MTPSSWLVRMNPVKFAKPKHGPGNIGTIPGVSLVTIVVDMEFDELTLVKSENQI